MLAWTFENESSRPGRMVVVEQVTATGFQLRRGEIEIRVICERYRTTGSEANKAMLQMYWIANNRIFLRIRKLIRLLLTVCKETGPFKPLLPRTVTVLVVSIYTSMPRITLNAMQRLYTFSTS